MLKLWSQLELPSTFSHEHYKWVLFGAGHRGTALEQAHLRMRRNCNQPKLKGLIRDATYFLAV